MKEDKCSPWSHFSPPQGVCHGAQHLCAPTNNLMLKQGEDLGWWIFCLFPWLFPLKLSAFSSHDHFGEGYVSLSAVSFFTSFVLWLLFRKSRLLFSVSFISPPILVTNYIWLLAMWKARGYKNKWEFRCNLEQSSLPICVRWKKPDAKKW